MNTVSRRAVISGTARTSGLLGLLALVPSVAACSSSSKTFKVFTDHEAKVVEEATARLIPGPTDDPAEAGHPGAREANVTRYIDTLLGAFDDNPPKVFAGGPFSNRAGATTDNFATFLPLTAAEVHAWTARLKTLRSQYTSGVKTLDQMAGGDFTKATNDQKDAILVKDPGGFATLMFQHAIEGTYGAPEYGGNANVSGWTEIKFPGDAQPRGYTQSQVENSDGPDPITPTAIQSALMKLVTSSTIA